MRCVVSADPLPDVNDVQDGNAVIIGIGNRHILQIDLAKRGLHSRLAVGNHDQFLFRMVHLVLRVGINVQDALVQIQGGTGQEKLSNPGQRVVQIVLHLQQFRLLY